MLDTNTRSRLIDQINRLIRQLPISNVSIRQRSRRLQRLVSNLKTVVLLVHTLHTTENLHSRNSIRGINNHRLEPTLQSRVTFNIFAVIILRSRTDNLQLTPSQTRFQNVRSINRTLSSTSTNHRVHLINEQHAVPSTLKLGDNLLKALLKLTTVLSTRNKRTHIQSHYPLTNKRVRHIALNNHVRKLLNNRRLTNTRLTNKNRVVLRPAAKNLNHTLNLGITTHNRIEIAIA